MAVTGFSRAEALAILQTWITKQVEGKIRYDLVMLQFATPVELPKGKDAKIRFPKERSMGKIASPANPIDIVNASGLSSNLNEDGTGGATSTIPIDYLERSVPFFGGQVEISETALGETPIDVMETVTDNVAKQAAESIDDRTMRESIWHSRNLRADNDNTYEAFNVAITSGTINTVVFPAANLPAGTNLSTTGNGDGATITFRSGANQGLSVRVDAAGWVNAAGTITATFANDVLPVAPSSGDLIDIASGKTLAQANPTDNIGVGSILRAVATARALGAKPQVMGKGSKWFPIVMSDVTEYNLLAGGGPAGNLLDLYKFTDTTNIDNARAGQIGGAMIYIDQLPVRCDDELVPSASGDNYPNVLIGKGALKAVKMWSGRQLDGVKIEVSIPGPQSTNDPHKQKRIVAWNARYVPCVVESRQMVNVRSASLPLV